MQITTKKGTIDSDLMNGDIILTSCDNPIMRPLKWVLGKLVPEYASLPEKWWHMAFVSDARKEIICEGWFPRVRLTRLLLNKHCKVYRWFDEPPAKVDIDRFVGRYVGKHYDISCYVWTILYYLTGKRLPRIYNRRFTCWEIVADLCLYFGEPWHDMYGYPLISDFIKAVGYDKEGTRD